jgi:HlyD family secretion protein
MRKWWIRIGILAALVVVGIVLKATVFKPEPVPVQVADVELGIVEETVTNSRAGTVKARRRATLSPEIGGQVIDLPFREGEYVHRGDVLLRIESSSQQARLVLAERERETAAAEQRRACLAAERASRELARTTRLSEDGIISTDLLDELESGEKTAEAACDAALANTSRAEAAVAVARTTLEKTEIRAPFDGILAEVSAEVGEYTTPSPPGLPIPPVIDVIDRSSIFISAPMDEVDSARIQAGQRARVSVDSHRDQTFPSQVTRVAPYVLDIEQQNRTVEIEVELDDDEFAATLLPGTSADVEVILRTRDGVPRIPTSALMEDNRVLILADDLLEERQLEIGLRNWDFIEVVSGLETGEQVVISLDRVEVTAGAKAQLAAEEN